MSFIFIPSNLDADAFEDESIDTLKEGGFLNIKAHNKRNVELTASRVETVWLADFH